MRPVRQPTREQFKKRRAQVKKVAMSEDIGSEVSGYGAVFLHAHCTDAIEEYFVDFGASAPEDE